MKPLDPPAITYRSLYRTAIAQTQRNADRAILAALEDRMVQAGEDYDTTLAQNGPHAVTPIAFTASEEALVSALYEKRIRDKSGACRNIYEQILTSASHCPYCEDGEIYEVDHFLPQAGHHDLVMYPSNLVPICHPCNHIKLQTLPVSAQQSFIHPYFDRLPTSRWLFARIDRQADGPVLNYWVQLDPLVHGALASRLNYHFSTLRLPERMRARSSKVLLELQSNADEYLGALGAEGLKLHFHDEGEKRFSWHGNTLEAAAYHAAATNDAFCAGEYRS